MGTLETNPQNIKEKWAKDFSILYNSIPLPQYNTKIKLDVPQPNPPQNSEQNAIPDGSFFITQINKKTAIIPPNWLNIDIAIEEIRWATSKAKKGKAGGIDQLPNELWKHPNFINLLQKLFQQYFESGQTQKNGRNQL